MGSKLSWEKHNNNYNIKPFIDIKCTYRYYTRISIMATHCKYDFNRESDIFTTEIGITHLKNLSTRYYLIVTWCFTLLYTFVNFYKTFFRTTCHIYHKDLPLKLHLQRIRSVVVIGSCSWKLFPQPGLRGDPLILKGGENVRSMTKGYFRFDHFILISYNCDSNFPLSLLYY